MHTQIDNEETVHDMTTRPIRCDILRQFLCRYSVFISQQGTAQSSHIVVPFIRRTMVSSKFHIFLFRNFIYFLVHALCALDGFIVSISMCVSSCHFVCVNCVNICQFFSLIVSGRETVYARLLPIQTSVDELLLDESPRNGCRAAGEREEEEHKMYEIKIVHVSIVLMDGMVFLLLDTIVVCAAAAMMTMTTQPKGFFFPVSALFRSMQWQWHEHDECVIFTCVFVCVWVSVLAIPMSMSIHSIYSFHLFIYFRISESAREKKRVRFFVTPFSLCCSVLHGVICLGPQIFGSAGYLDAFMRVFLTLSFSHT